VPESFRLAGLCLQDFDTVWRYGPGRGLFEEKFMVDDEERDGGIDVLADQHVLLDRPCTLRRGPAQLRQTTTPICGQACMVKKQSRAGRTTFRALEGHVGLGYALESRCVDDLTGVMAAKGIKHPAKQELNELENNRHIFDWCEKACVAEAECMKSKKSL
jgi:hypothetical protein